MRDEYAVSPTSIDRLEKGWLRSRGEEAERLHMHQCAAALLAFDDDKRKEAFLALFEQIGAPLRMDFEEVRKKLIRAKEIGILRLGGRLAIDIAARLKHALNEKLRGAGKPHSLRRVIVGAVETRYEPGEGDRVGAAADAAAKYFAKVVPTGPREGESEDPDIPDSRWVGVCGGRTVLRVVERIVAGPQRYDGLTVLPLAGEAEPNNFPISANSVVVRLAQGCGRGDYRMFSLMSSPYGGPEAELGDWRADQEANPSISDVLNRSRRVKFAFAGIGELGDPKPGTKRQSAIQGLKEYCSLETHYTEGFGPPSDCVGDMGYRPMNADGEPTWPQLYDRIVGLDLKDLKAMASRDDRRVFAVACGDAKVPGIIAAAMGGLINGLITDEVTALEIIDELERKKQQKHNSSAPDNDSCSFEDAWLKSRGEEVDRLHMHQFAAALLAFDDDKRIAAFASLLETIGASVSLAGYEVRQKLIRAKEVGILTLGGRLAIDIADCLERSLNKKLGEAGKTHVLKRVIVGAVKDRYEAEQDDRVAAAADAAADYFAKVVPTARPEGESVDHEAPDIRWVGVCGGRTVLRVVDAIAANPQRYDGLTVLPLAGEAEPENFPISANSVVARLAQACGRGRFRMVSLMSSPYVGPGGAALEQWQSNQRQNESISKVLEDSRKVRLAFAGIGEKDSEKSAIRRLMKYCRIPGDPPEDCVADMCYRPMNRRGEPTWPQLSDRVVGLDLKDLKNMAAQENRRVFAVACGEAKVPAIIAAVIGGLINGLITDELTAREIIDKLKKETEEG